MTVESIGRNMTGVLQNRPLVLQEIGRLIKRHRRRQRPFSLITVSIHNLDWFRDTLGLKTADSVLGYAADFIRAHVREVDVWYLCAPNTYLIIADETDAQAARVLVERLAAEATETKFTIGTDRMVLEMSFRTATCPDDGVDAEALLQAAGFSANNSPQS